jgi:bacterioferritin
VIAYVVYSQTLKGPQYMSIVKELEVHAGQELQHALTIAKQIDYLGGTPTTVPREVKMSAKADAMLQFDLDNEGETIITHRGRMASAKRSANMRSRKKFARFCGSSRNTKSIWPPR